VVLATCERHDAYRAHTVERQAQGATTTGLDGERSSALMLDALDAPAERRPRCRRR
jgi:hypothetical protein